MKECELCKRREETTRVECGLNVFHVCETCRAYLEGEPFEESNE
jgi:hypothetical protein